MNDFFLSVSQEIPSCPDFVFCIRVFCTAYKRNRCEFILPAKTVLSHFSVLVLERIVFSFRNHKSNQSLISYHTFVSTLQFQANKIISKFCTARRVKEQSEQATARQNLCWSSVQPKKEYDSIIPSLWFAKFQVDHPSGCQSVERNSYQFQKCFATFLAACTTSENISPFLGVISWGGWHGNQITLLLWYLLSETPV